MGGQTALNLCIEAQEKGIWSKHSVKIIGVDIGAIEITEDREKFRILLNKINIPVAPAESASSFLKGKEIAQKFGIRVYTIGVGTEGFAPYPFQTF